MTLVKSEITIIASGTQVLAIIAITIKKTKRQKIPKKDFHIVMSGQFCNLVMFLVFLKTIISKVLAPTSQTTNREEFCADDSHSGGGSTFEDAIAEVSLMIVFHLLTIWRGKSIFEDVMINKGG